MKSLIIANFKMNKTTQEIREYINMFNKLLPENLNREVCLCFPFTSLFLGKELDSRIQIGAQNMHEEESGQFTGEISVNMLKDLNVKTVIIGHSERRKYFNENNEKINKKIKTALRHGFRVVLCVGETRAQRNSNKTKETLKKQIEEALVEIYENELKSIIISYEPVWAIGTGKVASSSDISEAAKTIRGIISNHYSKEAGINQKIIYGGSLTSQNSKHVFKNKEICGALVGGASLNPEEFVKIFTE